MTAVALAAAVLGASAESSGADRLLRVLPLGDISGIAVLSAGEERLEVPLTAGVRSGDIAWPHGPHITVTAAGQTAPVDVSECGSQPLVLLELHEGELRVRALADDSMSFPAGAFRVLNSTPDLLRAALAGKSHEIAAGDSSVLLPGNAKTAFLQLMLVSGTTETLVLSNNLGVQPGIRNLIVVAPGQNGRAHVHRITDRPPATEKGDSE